MSSSYVATRYAIENADPPIENHINSPLCASCTNTRLCNSKGMGSSLSIGEKKDMLKRLTVAETTHTCQTACGRLSKPTSCRRVMASALTGLVPSEMPTGVSVITLYVSRRGFAPSSAQTTATGPFEYERTEVASRHVRVGLDDWVSMNEIGASKRRARPSYFSTCEVTAVTKACNKQLPMIMPVVILAFSTSPIL